MLAPRHQLKIWQNKGSGASYFFGYKYCFLLSLHNNNSSGLSAISLTKLSFPLKLISSLDTLDDEFDIPGLDDEIEHPGLELLFGVGGGVVLLFELL